MSLIPTVVLLSEFGSLISICKTLFTFFNHNSHVEFAKRNANKVTHSLEGVALFSASPQDFDYIPTCISSLIINKMH